MSTIHAMKLSDSLGYHMKLNTARVAPLTQSVVEKNSVPSGDLSLSSSHSQSSGWGNAESRKTCKCLASLVDEDVIPTRRAVSIPTDTEEWGYFTDTKDKW